MSSSSADHVKLFSRPCEVLLVDSRVALQSGKVRLVPVLTELPYLHQCSGIQGQGATMHVQLIA